MHKYIYIYIYMSLSYKWLAASFADACRFSTRNLSRPTFEAKKSGGQPQTDRGNAILKAPS